MRSGIDTEGSEGGNDDENGCPPVVKGEGEVDKEFVIDRLGSVMFLDDVIDVL
jgi:hypothetical protein